MTTQKTTTLTIVQRLKQGRFSCQIDNKLYILIPSDFGPFLPIKGQRMKGRKYQIINAGGNFIFQDNGGFVLVK